MLDIQYIRDHADAVQQNAEKRNVRVDISRILDLDEQIRSHVQQVDALRTERNTIAKELQASKGGKPELVERGKELKKNIAEIESELEEFRSEYTDLMMQVPNLTHPDSPTGKDDTENVEKEVYGKPTEFSFEPKDHLTLGQELDVLDFERGAEVSGHGFYFKKGGAALLDFALSQYAFNVCMSNGFEPMITPDLARQSVLQGTGYNPRGDETQIYSIENTDLSLVATAEIPVAGYYQNHVFKKGELDQPKKIVAFSHCFRTEAGSHGRESRGLYRVHQFTKVEMFIYCRPEQSEEMLEHLKDVEVQLVKGLDLPFRVVDICTGDLGGSAYKKYDLEAWMPFKDDWGEITSTSNCTDYQARRLNIRYEDENGKKHLVHTLNGTAVATTRLPIAIMENYQQEDGTIPIPDALHPYMLGKTVIE